MNRKESLVNAGFSADLIHVLSRVGVGPTVGDVTDFLKLADTEPQMFGEKVRAVRRMLKRMKRGNKPWWYYRR